jgi:hypothetical protein
MRNKLVVLPGVVALMFGANATCFELRLFRRAHVIGAERE